MKKHIWTELSKVEENKIWSAVYNCFNFKPSIYEKNFPGFKEPSPSITYSFSDIWRDNFDDLNRDLHIEASRIFKKLIVPDDFLYALDWQHPCYRFYPHKASLYDTKEWMIPALPNGDYYISLEKSLKFGWLGHPWEETICVFGEPLLCELKIQRPKIFRKPIRQKVLFEN